MCTCIEVLGLFPCDFYEEAKGGLMYPYFPNQFFEFKQCTYSRESLDQSKQKKGKKYMAIKSFGKACPRYDE